MTGNIDGQALARERKYLFAFAMVRLRDPDLADDAVQETLVAAWRAADRFEQRCTLRTWLVTILINKIADLKARQGREIPVEEIVESSGDDDDPWFDETGRWQPEAMPHPWSSPEKAVEQREFWGVFERCLQAMPPRIGEVFVLREVLGESIEDICKALDISASNCSVMLFRARASLRSCLQQKWFGGAQ
jgi:RNA polymerase sigma-70 factor (ECF subfamily)